MFGGYFDVDGKKASIKSLEEKLQTMQQKELWGSKETIDLSKKISDDNKIISNVEKLKETLDSYEEIIDYNDEDLIKEITLNISDLKKQISDLEMSVKLSSKEDKENAILEIHSGAGGTESCDWASMLLRMYLRWCDKKSFKYEILDTLYGEEAGIKRVTVLIKGLNAYGYLKSEKGVHRLVRLSPFDSANRRHTSFASVEVTPQINDEINIEIKDSDIKIDVYRSSGPGGQGVNTTDSAVRITHIATGITVTCQNERSQLKNKEIAMKILKSKLYLIEEEKRRKELDEEKKNQSDINFGSQIRSYVMHPYSMVKDHRTGEETSDVQKVLDGDIDKFIEGYLKM